MGALCVRFCAGKRKAFLTSQYYDQVLVKDTRTAPVSLWACQLLELTYLYLSILRN